MVRAKPHRLQSSNPGLLACVQTHLSGNESSFGCALPPGLEDNNACGGDMSTPAKALQNGTLANVDICKMMATYSAEMRADGTLYGECPNSGLVMAADGMATFRATGIGTFTEDGGATFKGMVYFQTSAPSLASLNGAAVVYNWDVDAEGNAAWELWQWK